MTELKTVNNFPDHDNLIILSDREHLAWANDLLSSDELDYLHAKAEAKVPFLTFVWRHRLMIIEFISSKDTVHKQLESARMAGAARIQLLRQYKLETASLQNYSKLDVVAAYAEGLALANYQFLKYFSDKTKATSFKTLNIYRGALGENDVKGLSALIDAVCKSRDLVNEPQSFLTAPQMSLEIEKLGKEAGFEVTVFDKAKIEELGMGGVLAVNRGSIVPPTFNILEWKPADAKNSQPIVLVGKGVVYDTGGLSLKPTANSMDFMKCDMGGAATVIGAMYAIAKAKLPLHIVCLVPATDNRPGGDAYAPGDVIHMYSGATVEVLNTDAEGRMILADALHYAKQYDPELVLDFATLTGSAAAAIGDQAAVYMGNASDSIKASIENSGFEVHERLVQFPLWAEYKEQLKSDIADIKNLGGARAGATTAGKFLEHFTDYSWLHFDIAGVAYKHQEDGYRIKGGTGFGVRLLFNFFKNY
ncbi:MAG: leucyl aminopeptidase [Aureispira sp.]|nr:leucyl aminopeptidase [Aureispira sp.]